MKLKPEEQLYVSHAIKECVKCGHLDIFHNYHYCTFCNIPGCRCEYECDTKERDGTEDPAPA